MIGSANGRRIGITGLGVHVPDQVFTNDDLTRFVDTSDEWIVERTGIRERRWVEDGMSGAEMARRASLMALEDAGIVVAPSPAEMGEAVLKAIKNA